MSGKVRDYYQEQGVALRTLETQICRHLIEHDGIQSARCHDSGQGICVITDTMGREYKVEISQVGGPQWKW